MTSAPNSCRFCAIVGAAQPTAEFDRPILASDKYFSIPSLGGFVGGWTLICPRRHEVNLSREYGEAEFLAFAARVYDAVVAEYGPAVIFEHGADREGSATGCGTDHAHMHIVPLKASLSTLVRSYDDQAQWTPCLLPQVQQYSAGNEYLFMSDRFELSATAGELCLLTRPQSQFFRRVLAEGLGLSGSADYRTEPLRSGATTTGIRLRERLRRESAFAA